MNHSSFSVARVLVVGLAAAVLSCGAADLGAGLPQGVERPVSFEGEIKPILERSCAECHSGAKPKGKFSVESREGILRGGDSKDAAIVVGKSGSSPLVHFVADLTPEMEMPPVGKRSKFAALSREEIGLLRGWIDQGAKWPEGVRLTVAATTAAAASSAAGAGDLKEGSSAAAAVKHDVLFDMIRAGDRRGIAKALKNPGAVNLRDAEGNTPLIQAAFYLDGRAVADLIDRGADVNATNEAGVSALMKAVWDLEKTRVLLKRGANVNAASRNGNTALISAAFAYGASDVVKALIAGRANVEAVNGLGGNALLAAAESGDLESMRALLDRGVSPDSKTHIIESGAEASALMIASVMGHLDGVKLLLERGANVNLRTEHGNALDFAAMSNRREVARFLLDRGIDVDVAGQRVGSFRKDKGLTPLMYACATERNDATLVRWLIERGANVNAKASSGETPLGVALQRGNTKVVAALVAAGAKCDEAAPAEKLAAHWNAEEVSKVDAAVLRTAVKDGVAIVVKSGARMSEATGNRCASCHQTSIPAMAWASARAKGFDYPEGVAKEQLAASFKASQMFAGMSVEMPLPVPNIAAWYLIGWGAAGKEGDAFTDKFAYSLARYQYGDGRWVTKAARAPTDYSDVTSTAAAIRALKLYAPPTLKGRMDRQVAKAAAWLRGYRAESTEERAMQILGLHWAGAAKGETEKLAPALLAEQRGDGGWSQLGTLESDAYATGLALHALRQAGAIAAADAKYQRGVKFLLRTQLADGSWLVKTRASPVQVAIDDIFPHGKDQWISTVATGWASMALMEAAEGSKAKVELRASK